MRPGATYLEAASAGPLHLAAGARRRPARSGAWEHDSRLAVPLRSHSRAPRFGQVGSAPRAPGSRSLFSDSLWVPRWEERTGARPSKMRKMRGENGYQRFGNSLGPGSVAETWTPGPGTRTRTLSGGAGLALAADPLAAASFRGV